jgi:hypothetical protein
VWMCEMNIKRERRVKVTQEHNLSCACGCVK